MDETYDIYLKSLKDSYLASCEANNLIDWRYYFIKYNVFRPDRYGKYWIKDNNYYLIYAMVTQSKLSEYAYQPFLKVVDLDHLDKANTGQRLKYDNRYVYCEGNIQVAMRIFNDIFDENGKLITEEREYAPLETITDGYPRYLLTLDKLLQKRSGVKHMNLINFMLKNERFI